MAASGGSGAGGGGVVTGASVAVTAAGVALAGLASLDIHQAPPPSSNTSNPPPIAIGSIGGPLPEPPPKDGEGVRSSGVSSGPNMTTSLTLVSVNSFQLTVSS
jgi:hypothetical protein